MRQSIVLSTLLLISFFLSGQEPSDLLPANQHLLAINQQWQDKLPDATASVKFKDDTERIAYHLGHVISRLQAVELEDPSKQTRREALVQQLSAYANERQFPINTYHPIRTPYFIDSRGTACAVGHLMIASGHEALALRIHSEHNYDYIADITTEGVDAWAKHYGFTLDELALIQPAYAPVNTLNTVGNGVNGPISKLCAMLDERLYIAGDFDMMDGISPCEIGFGYLENGIYHCMTGAPDGEINDMKRGSNYDLLIAGNLSMSGANMPAALYSDGNWNYIQIPERPAAIGKSIKYQYNEYSRYLLAIDPQDGTGNNELWRYNASGNGSWHLVVTATGEIVSDVADSYLNYYGGNFDSYIDHTADGMEVECDGLFRVELYSASAEAVMPYTSEFLPDEITCLLAVGEIIYIGGVCDIVYPNTYLSRLQNNSIQALVYREDSFGQTNVGVYDLEVISSQDLLVGGDIVMNDFGTIGNNLGTYDLLGGSLSALAYLDAPVHSLAQFQGLHYLGGEFTDNVGYPVSNIASIGVSTSISEDSGISSSFGLSPNPASDYINIRWDDTGLNVSDLQITDVSGKSVSLDYLRDAGQVTADISQLNAGVYTYSVISSGGIATGTFIKD